MQSTSDPCIYVCGCELMVGVYVDDIVIGGNGEKNVKDFKLALGQKFDVEDLGRLHYILGIEIAEDVNTGNLWMSQPTYIEKVLQKFGMTEAKSVASPVDPSTKLIKDEGEEEKVEVSQYLSAVGSLLLSAGTRPDITFAVCSVAKFCSEPRKSQWTVMKRILRYFKGTLNHGLLYSHGEQQDCFGYSDSDFAGDLNDRKSTSGYIFMLSGAGISWRSKKQTSVALSTAEAEYIALSISVQEAMWLKQLTSELVCSKVQLKLW